MRYFSMTQQVISLIPANSKYAEVPIVIGNVKVRLFSLLYLNR
jgi:hypothetical protein